MKTNTLILLQAIKSVAAAALVLSAAAISAFAAEADGDLQPIFNGKDLSGWKEPAPNPFWKVVDGVLVGENDISLKGNMLYTQESYSNFVFEAEVRWSPEADTGFMVRKPELQMQIGISGNLKRDMTCSFYTGAKERYPEAGQAKEAEKYLKPGDWNRIRLQAKGDTFTVWLNGQRVSEYTNPRYAEAGPIGLQIHPKVKMKAEFRNIKAGSLD